MLRERPRTVVFVTHDIEEAAQLADRVVVLSERPARIRAEVSIATPRPRDATEPQVVAAMHRVLTVAGPGIRSRGETRMKARDRRSFAGRPEPSPSSRALAALRTHPWQRHATAQTPEEQAAGAPETLTVGYLPVTCHLTCPVTDYATQDQPHDALRVGALHRLPDRGRGAEGGRNRRDVHARAARDDADASRGCRSTSSTSATATARR